MLIGAHISIGPIIPADFPSMFCWANDVAAARLNLGYRPVDFNVHKEWCESFGRDQTKVNFAIRKLDEPAIVGLLEIINISLVHRSAEIGIRIGDEANRGRGYGKEALGLALAFCWNHLNLNRAQLIVLRHNERAQRAYRAVGFEQEGLLRNAVFVDGAWADLVVMSALRPAATQQRVLGVPFEVFARPESLLAASAA
jgi:RimJ/RimL family protein N-acetyltransferase